MNYKDDTTTDKYPKTLLIRNQIDGCIWQVYHVPNSEVANLLAGNAMMNGFEGRELVEYMPEHEETFPRWQNKCNEDITKALLGYDPEWETPKQRKP